MYKCIAVARAYRICENRESRIEPAENRYCKKQRQEITTSIQFSKCRNISSRYYLEKEYHSQLRLCYQTFKIQTRLRFLPFGKDPPTLYGAVIKRQFVKFGGSCVRSHSSVQRVMFGFCQFHPIRWCFVTV